MKQLKFMLAAATAVALATAAQAALTTNTTGFVSQDFDDIGETDVPNSEISALSVFSYDGDSQDNESKIVVESGTDLALSVNTSTNPILCTVQNSGAAYDLADADKAGYQLYIDTMVQFTVTPAGDIVTNTPADKLMIYLQEVLETKNEAGETVPPSTNLMVKATKYTPANGRFDAKFEPVDGDVKLLGITVLPGEWYRLVVEVSKCQDQGVQFAQFRIKMAKDGEQLVTLTNDRGLVNTDNTLFPSLQGKFDQENNSDATTIQYVGFAGEGMVDDIVVAEVFEAPDVVDFTFAIDIDDGVNTVVYTIGEGDAAVTNTITADKADITVASGTKVTLKKINLNALYVLASDSAKENDFKTITANGESFVVKTTALTGKDDATVPNNTKPADIGIVVAGDNSTGLVDAEPAELNSIIKWATANKGSSTSIDVINSMRFDGNEPKNAAAEAYLLNCAPTADALKTAKDNFKFEAFNPDNFDAESIAEWIEGVVEALNGKGYNGDVAVQGAATLGAWGEPDENSKFFKAVLTR